MADNNLVPMPVHHSLVRPQMLLGGEVMATVSNMIVAVAFALSSASLVVCGLSALMFAVVQLMLVNAAKRDPQGLEVYRRHIKYQDCYPAQSGPAVGETVIRDHFKI